MKKRLVELRVRNLDQVEACLRVASGKVDKISVGDEGCVHRVPTGEFAVSLRKRVEESGFRFGLVTSKIPEVYVQRFIDTLATLCQRGKEFELTANDVGFLYGCKLTGSLPDSVLIGRTLSRSIQDCPWPLATIHSVEEREDYRKQNSLWDGDKLEFYRQFNVVGIECNYLEENHASLERIYETGAKVALHLGTSSVSFARACPVAKINKVAVPGCKNLCDKPAFLELEEVLQGRKLLPAPRGADGHLFGAILLGNVLYRAQKTKGTVLPPVASDRVVIHDWNYATISQLESHLNRVVEEVGHE